MRRVIAMLVLGGVVSCGGEPGPDSASVEVLSAEGSQDEMARFSPDGSMIAFYRSGENGDHLWVANADMGDARDLGVWSLGANPLFWSPDSRMIAFGANMRNLADIAVVSVADGEVTYLSDSPAFHLPVGFSADGRSVVYAAFSGGTVVGGLAPVDGSGPTPFFPDMEQVYVGFPSPDGSKVLYNSGEPGGHTTVWVADASGENHRQLTTQGFEGANFEPWSPDGSEVLFASTRTGRSNIWAVSVADGVQRQITSDIRDDLEPIWSPDGTQIAFISTRGRQRDVWVVPAAGGEPVRVTDDPANEVSLSWRDDGSLVFSAGSSPGSIWRRSLADGSEVRLTPDSVDTNLFNLSPDRSRATFTITLPGGDTDVAIMPVDGGEYRVVSTGGNNTGPMWNPAGDQVAFSSNRSGNQDIWVVDAEGSAPARQVTNWTGSENLIGWSADGMAVIVFANHDARLSDIWRVPIDGGEPERLTTHGAVNGASYSWDHPDGEMVLSLIDDSDGSIRLWKRAVTGALTPFGPEMQGGIAGLPGWSEDGEMFVMFSNVAGESRTDLMSADGQTVLATLPARGQAFSRHFSRDGTKLLTAIIVEGQSEIGILDIATGEHTMLTDTPEDETTAAFTSDGESVIMRRVSPSLQAMVADVSGLLAPSSDD